MANPQVEDGHTDLANELVEALASTHLSPSESKVLWAIIRKTYGWHKKTDRISYTQLEILTKLDRWHIAPALKRLINRNIVFRIGNGQNLEYGVQKNWEIWKPVPIKQAPKTITDFGNALTVTDNGNGCIGSVTDNGNGHKPLPILEKPLPILEKPLPIQVMKPLPISVNTKENKTTTKENTKTTTGSKSEKRLEEIEKEKKEDFVTFRENLRKEYSDLDFDQELKGFAIWWSEGEKKLQRPKSALRNWMIRAREKKNSPSQRKESVYEQSPARIIQSVPGNRPAGAFANLDNN